MAPLDQTNGGTCALLCVVTVFLVAPVGCGARCVVCGFFFLVGDTKCGVCVW